MTGDLADIFLRLPSVPLEDLARIRVSSRASQIVGGVRQGKRGWILPVYIDPPSIYRSVDDPALIDLAVFSPDKPSNYRTIYGVGNMLGEAAFQEARFYRVPLPVFRTPLPWLQSGGAGVVPLDLPSFARAVIGTSVRLVAEDLQHGEHLNRAIRSAVRFAYPEIQVAA